MKELCALGFSDEARCHEVLRQSGGEVRGALALLQRPLLEPFHKRIWSDKPEPPVDIHHPDKQVRQTQPPQFRLFIHQLVSILFYCILFYPFIYLFIYHFL